MFQRPTIMESTLGEIGDYNLSTPSDPTRQPYDERGSADRNE